MILLKTETGKFSQAKSDQIVEFLVGVDAVAFELSVVRRGFRNKIQMKAQRTES